MKILNRFLYSQKIAPYVFIAPFILVFLIFFLYPVISAFVMSFQSVIPGQVKFVGLDNYANLNDPTFFKAIKTNLIYTILTLALLIPFPLLFACFLNSKFMVFKNIFRSTFFIPALTSVVVAGTIFRLLFGELPHAFLNELITNLGFHSIKWLKQPETSMLALVALACWRWTGVNILYFLSGLQGIPADLYESADIDGASTAQQFVYVTIPMLKPVIIYVLTISIYAGMSMFTESYMLYAGNASPNDTGLTIIGYLYRMAWEQYRIGFGCAIGITLLAITLGVNLIQLKFFGLFSKED